MAVYVCVISCFGRVWLFAALWTVALQVPLSTGFSRQEWWSGFPAFHRGIFLTQGLNSRLLRLLLAGRVFTTSTTWEAPSVFILTFITRQSIYGDLVLKNENSCCSRNSLSPYSSLSPQHPLCLHQMAPASRQSAQRSLTDSWVPGLGKSLGTLWVCQVGALILGGTRMVGNLQTQLGQGLSGRPPGGLFSWPPIGQHAQRQPPSSHHAATLRPTWANFTLCISTTK